MTAGLVLHVLTSAIASASLPQKTVSKNAATSFEAPAILFGPPLTLTQKTYGQRVHARTIDRLAR
jgi:hypothetical protein